MKQRERSGGIKAVERAIGTLISGVIAGSLYRFVTHPMVNLQYRIDREWEISHSPSHAPLPAASSSSSSAASTSVSSTSNFTCTSSPQSPTTRVSSVSAWQSWVNLCRSEGWFWFVRNSEPPLGTRLARIFSPSVMGLLVYELTKEFENENEKLQLTYASNNI